MEPPKAPPDVELRNIIDKLAEFVARNGPDFEQMTKTKQKGNPKFAFLFGGEYFSYYQYKVSAEQTRLHLAGAGSILGINPPNPAGPQLWGTNNSINPMQQQVAAIQQQHVTMMASAGAPTAGAVTVPPGTTMESLTEQQAALQEQSSQSERNLNAHHQALLHHQQVQIDEMIRKTENENMSKAAEADGINLTEMDVVLQPIIDTCTKESISNGKTWLLQHATTTQAAESIANYLLLKITEPDRKFHQKLHIIYLINDVMHHCCRKHIDVFKDPLEKVVVPMFSCASLNVTEEQQTKLTKLLTIWETKNNYFSQDVVKVLKDTTKAWNEYKQSLLTKHQSIVDQISQQTKASYQTFQSQHIAFVQHTIHQIQALEQQKQTLEAQNVAAAAAAAALAAQQLAQQQIVQQQQQQQQQLSESGNSRDRDDDGSSRDADEDGPPGVDQSELSGSRSQPPRNYDDSSGGSGRRFRESRFDRTDDRPNSRFQEGGSRFQEGSSRFQEGNSQFLDIGTRFQDNGPSRFQEGSSQFDEEGSRRFSTDRQRSFGEDIRRDSSLREGRFQEGRFMESGRFSEERFQDDHFPRNQERFRRDERESRFSSRESRFERESRFDRTERFQEDERFQREERFQQDHFGDNNSQDETWREQGRDQTTNDGQGFPPVNLAQPPPPFVFQPPPNIELPDVTRPPPGFPPVVAGAAVHPAHPLPTTPGHPAQPDIHPEDLLPSLPYYDLPAGLMVPLVKLEETQYRPLEPDQIRLPPPAPPSERLVAAVKSFYAPPGHDHPRDPDGWERLGLYEYFRAKANAKKIRDQEIEQGIRQPSRSPTPVRSYYSGDKTPPPRRRYSSRSRSRSKERDEKTPSAPRRRRGRRERQAERPAPQSLLTMPILPPPPGHPDYNPSGSTSPPSSFKNLKEEDKIAETNKGHQLLKKMGWTGTGLGANQQGIENPIEAADVRDKSDKYKGIGINLNDPYENFRKSKGQAFISRMKARAEERAAV